MRYWYAPLRPEPGNIFTTANDVNARMADPLYVGEITKEAYERIVLARTLASEEEDEFGLPINRTTEDEFGL